MKSVIVLTSVLTYAVAASLPGPCLFDGRLYDAGETIVIAHCLASMQCLGDNNYGNLVSLGGVCPEKREVDGQTGCLFDGKVYAAGDKIVIQPCLAEMTCEGNNVYSYPKSLGGVCDTSKRQTDGQSGCWFDGTVYSSGEKIVIPNCLGEMTCLGQNSYSDITSYGGVCPEKEAREVDGQTGCLFDGRVYAAGDTIYVGDCLAKFECLGYNRLSQPVSLGGVC